MFIVKQRGLACPEYQTNALSITKQREPKKPSNGHHPVTANLVTSLPLHRSVDSMTLPSPIPLQLRSGHQLLASPCVPWSIPRLYVLRVGLLCILPLRLLCVLRLRCLCKLRLLCGCIVHVWSTVLLIGLRHFG